MASGPSSLWLSYLPVPGSDLKALYTQGTDNRLNIFNLTISPEIRNQALSVACLVENRFLDETEEPCKFIKIQKLKDRFGPFATPPQFHDESAPGFATAFFVADGLALTASHCVCDPGTHIISEERIKKIRLLFGFRMKTATEHHPIYKKSICCITDIVRFSRSSKDGDWALVQLNKNPDGAHPLALDFINVVHHPLPIYMLGHPSGLPLKYTQNGTVVEAREETQAGEETQFEAAIDAFAGNSGSPVFNNLTKKVIGILVAGKTDYVTIAGFTELNQVSSEQIREKGHERCQRIATLPDEVVRIIASKAIQPTQQIQPPSGIIARFREAQGLLSIDMQRAIEILSSLAESGVQAANCALAGVDKDPGKQAIFKQRALRSGFFTEEEVGAFITSFLNQPPTQAIGIDITAGDQADVDIIPTPGGITFGGGIRASGGSRVRIGAGLSVRPTTSLPLPPTTFGGSDGAGKKRPREEDEQEVKDLSKRARHEGEKKEASPSGKGAQEKK